VARCCELKAGVVSEDEREETGLRVVLNFGHTIGHAIEGRGRVWRGLPARGGGGRGHGGRVRLAERVFGIDPAITARIAALLERFGLPTSARAWTAGP
jgi:3-dehydroquinate synthase